MSSARRAARDAATLALPLAFALALTACHCQRAPAPAPVTDELMRLAAELPVGVAAAPPTTARAELTRVVDRAAVAVRGLRGEAAVTRLNRLVFEELGFTREVERQDPELMLLPHVVARRRGSCLGLAALYLALGERLDLPLRGVLVPGHFFVRLAGTGPARNLELLRRGEALPDGWYRERYRVPAGAGAYLRSLSRAETLAVFRYNLGNALRERGRHDAALAAYTPAAADFPAFAEAHANAGREHQRRRDGARAEAAYLRALAHNPCLEGLDGNLAALYRERGEERPAALHEARAATHAARCYPGPE